MVHRRSPLERGRLPRWRAVPRSLESSPGLSRGGCGAKRRGGGAISEFVFPLHRPSDGPAPRNKLGEEFRSSALLADQPRRLAQGRPAAGDVAAFEQHRDGAAAARCPFGDGTAPPVAGTRQRLLFDDHGISPPCFRKKRLAINAIASFPAKTKALYHRRWLNRKRRRFVPPRQPRRSKPIVEGKGPE